jgi:hypothetical protein
MFQWMNRTLDKVSEYLSARKGLLPLIGIFFILINFVLQFLAVGWLKTSNLFLHLGLVIAIFGLMLAWAL